MDCVNYEVSIRRIRPNFANVIEKIGQIFEIRYNFYVMLHWAYEHRVQLLIFG